MQEETGTGKSEGLNAGGTNAEGERTRTGECEGLNARLALGTQSTLAGKDGGGTRPCPW